MDITEFYDTFFEEADELLAEMESHLLELDVDNPDVERLNAIFRAAHSIKGGAGTFGFEALQRTTHLLENLLDYTRRGELALRRDIVDTFLEAKDMLNDQLDAYRQGGEPDPEALERICETLRRLALEELGEAWRLEPGPAPFKWGLIRRVGEIARAMHGAGVNHRDFYLGHFLIDRGAVAGHDAGAPLYALGPPTVLGSDRRIGRELQRHTSTA